MAHVDIVDYVEQPKLGFALKSDPRPEWIDLIKTESHDKQE